MSKLVVVHILKQPPMHHPTAMTAMAAALLRTDRLKSLQGTPIQILLTRDDVANDFGWGCAGRVYLVDPEFVRDLTGESRLLRAVCEHQIVKSDLEEIKS